MPEHTPLIEAHGLHVYYGASHVLHGVDLIVHRGECVGLLGRNGMGKTTLLKSMVGLLPPRQGVVRIRGLDTTRAGAHGIARQGVAYVPEGRGIFPNLSVLENLVMAARPGAGGAREWTLERVLETFPALAARLAHGGQQLSGGEQQMLTIGRALLTNPELLILDEATEGLAPLVAEQIWAVLRRIRATGMAVIVVDKNYRSLAAITQRNLIMVKGRIAFEGSGEELQRRPELLQQHLGI